MAQTFRYTAADGSGDEIRIPVNMDAARIAIRKGLSGEKTYNPPAWFKGPRREASAWTFAGFHTSPAPAGSLGDYPKGVEGDPLAPTAPVIGAATSDKEPARLAIGDGE